MALTASGVTVTNGRGVIDRMNISVCGIVNPVVRSAQHVELQRDSIRPILSAPRGPSNCSMVNNFGSKGSNVKHGSSLLCCLSRMPDTEAAESVRHHSDSRDMSRYAFWLVPSFFGRFIEYMTLALVDSISCGLEILLSSDGSVGVLA